MDDKGKSKVIFDDKLFVSLVDDDDDNNNDNDNKIDLFTSFQNSFKTLKSEPVIEIEDDDNDNDNDDNNNNPNPKPKPNPNPNPGPLAQPFTCNICQNTKPKYKSINVKNCTHFFCCECIEAHVMSKLGDGASTVGDVHCPVPDCTGSLDPEYCKDFISRDVYDIWGRKLCEWAIGDGYKCYCPFSDCSGLLVKDFNDITNAECPYCHRMFCAVCRVVWHQGSTCEQFQRMKLNNGC